MRKFTSDLFSQEILYLFWEIFATLKTTLFVEIFAHLREVKDFSHFFPRGLRSYEVLKKTISEAIKLTLLGQVTRVEPGPAVGGEDLFR